MTQSGLSASLLDAEPSATPAGVSEDRRSKRRRQSRPATSATSVSSPFIASRGYDSLLFIFSPLLALLAAEILTPLHWAFERTHALGGVDSRVSIFIGVFTTAHLFAVLFRSHANPEMFSRHRARFTVVPVLLFVAMLGSEFLLIVCLVLAAVWDVYHSSLQNFGLCRIWDARQGNDPDTGRALDRWLAHAIYIAPILAGPSLHKTLEGLEHFDEVGWSLPGQLLELVDRVHPALAAVVSLVAGVFVAYYIFAYWRLAGSGYRISPQKIVFLISLGFTSVLAWGFLPPLEAFFVANFFHNLQYFGIIWWAEKKTIRRVFGLATGTPDAFALVAYLGSLLLVAMACEAGSRSNIQGGMALGLVVALMHFWYDGFIWSVRQHQVDPVVSRS
jgi:hypothetical protein